ncbi:hypothetical protein BaRGS_00004686 [Batillaria attramentaria]|uniref:Uncharacterized protein n=1 Tax=Batillaria attramentaria TaxID=370345 RepID=A0ABD0LWI0_9CAEN
MDTSSAMSLLIATLMFQLFTLAPGQGVNCLSGDLCAGTEIICQVVRTKYCCVSGDYTVTTNVTKSARGDELLVMCQCVSTPGKVETACGAISSAAVVAASCVTVFLTFVVGSTMRG